MRKSNIIYIVFVLVLFSSEKMFAPPPPPPPGVPIDGGSLYLLISGLILGVASFIKRKE